MYPSIVVYTSKLQWVAYPCRPDVAPRDVSILPMIGVGDSANEAVIDLKNSIKKFVELNGVVESNKILDSIYGKGNHVDIKILHHPMMKYFTEII